MDTNIIIDIYADIIFLINTAVNAAILYIAGVLRRKRIRLWRIAAAAAVSATLYTVAIFTPAAPFVNVLTSFVILAPAIPIAMPTSGRTDFALSLLAAYICGFAVAGVAMATVHILNIGGGWGISTYGFAMDNFTPQNLVIAIIISFIVLKFAKTRIFSKTMSAQAFCRLWVHMADVKVELVALIDTGNELIEPISRRPVIVAEFDKIRSLLPDEVVRLYEQDAQDDLTALASSFTQGGMNTRIRLIPFSSVGKNGVIAGFRPDKVEVERAVQRKGRGGRKQQGIAVAVAVEAIIGICDFKLSDDGEYNALMSPSI